MERTTGQPTPNLKVEVETVTRIQTLSSIPQHTTRNMEKFTYFFSYTYHCKASNKSVGRGSGSFDASNPVSYDELLTFLHEDLKLDRESYFIHVLAFNILPH